MTSTDPSSACPQCLKPAIESGHRPSLIECVEAVAPEGIPGREDQLTDELAAAVREHSAGVADFADGLSHLHYLGQSAVESYLSDFDGGVSATTAVPTLNNVAEDRRTLAFHLVEQATRLASEAARLTPRVITERRNLQSQLHEAAQEIEADVEAKLIEAGQPKALARRDIKSNERVQAARSASTSQQTLIVELERQRGVFQQAAEESHGLLALMAEWVAVA